MMNVVAYIRASSDKQVASPSRQRDAITEYAHRKGYQVTAWFEDFGISGDDDDRRVDFLAMLDAADQGGFSRILVFDRARFGRGDSIEAAKWTSRLRKARVQLETVADGKVVDWSTMPGRISDAIAAEVAADYQRTLARNTLSGKLTKLRDVTANGLAGQPPTYGRLREVVRVEGSRIISTSIVDPATGPIVVRMFRMYAEPGGSIRKIATTLNQENIPPLRGEAWSCSAVRGVLENPIHVGDYRYGVRQSGKHASLDAGSTLVDRDRTDPLRRKAPMYFRDVVEPTVSRELFDKVQQLLKERARQTVPERKVKPLSGIIACGNCGQTMRSMYAEFRCCGDPRFGKACRGYVAHQQSVTSAVMAGIREAYTKPDRLRSLRTELRRLADKHGEQPAPVKVKALRREIASIDRKIAGAVEKVLLMPPAAAAEIGKRIEQLKAQRNALEVEITAQAGASFPAAEELVEEAVGVLRELGKTAASGSPKAINETLRRMGARATLEVTPKSKAIRVTFGNPPRKGGSKPKKTARKGPLRLSRSPRAPPRRGRRAPWLRARRPGWERPS
jgi:site-specific DNA recombinase